MKQHSINYQYDPQVRRLDVCVDGVPRGGFMGRVAERQLARLLENENVNISITDMKDKIHSAKVRRLRALWINQGIDKYREDILEQYGVGSTADLTDGQLDELIIHYSSQANKPASETTRRLRSDCLSLLTRLGVYSDSGSWARVNEYLMDSRIAGKLLYQMNNDELNALRRKLNAILDKRDDMRSTTLLAN